MTKRNATNKPTNSSKATNKTTGKPRGRPKKVLVGNDVELTINSVPVDITFPAPVNKAIDVTPKVKPEVHYGNLGRVASEPKPSLYSRFKDWLVFKLYYYTSYFRGF